MSNHDVQHESKRNDVFQIRCKCGLAWGSAVYHDATGADDPVEERTHNFDFDDPDGFPCRCGANNCPDGGLNYNPYI